MYILYFYNSTGECVFYAKSRKIRVHSYRVYVQVFTFANSRQKSESRTTFDVLIESALPLIEIVKRHILNTSVINRINIRCTSTCVLRLLNCAKWNFAVNSAVILDRKFILRLAHESMGVVCNEDAVFGLRLLWVFQVTQQWTTPPGIDLVFVDGNLSPSLLPTFLHIRYFNVAYRDASENRPFKIAVSPADFESFWWNRLAARALVKG